MDDQLRGDHLRSDQLRSDIASRLSAHTRRPHPLDGRRHAAVAVVITDGEADPFNEAHGEPAELTDRALGRIGEACFLLSRRAATLRAHTRQWALPGGRVDDGEDAVDAALRELYEELGVMRTRADVLGLLDDYPTRSGYVITPVVVWGGPDTTVLPNPDEVARCYRVRLSELQRDGSPAFITIPESDRPVVQVLLGDNRVHAPTGAVLLQFRWVCLDGRIDERVDHLEQPVFAWK
jgi:8-oxo-dGTP pyrophosphatase MutT (NUDIX family)